MNRQLAREAISISENLGKQLHALAHDFGHINRVRSMAVQIANEEGLASRDIFLIEIAALWHDLGLDKAEDRSMHGEKASELFLKQFPGQEIFSNIERSQICFLITFHDKARLVRKPETDKHLLKMLNILTDADTLDLLGEHGYRRALETVEASNWPLVDVENPRGTTFGFSAKQFDERVELKKIGKIKNIKEPTLVGQLNFQISCADNLYSKTGKALGMAGAEYLKAKLSELVDGR